jgi:hypothetical protein
MVKKGPQDSAVRRESMSSLVVTDSSSSTRSVARSLGLLLVATAGKRSANEARGKRSENEDKQRKVRIKHDKRWHAHVW